MAVCSVAAWAQAAQDILVMEYIPAAKLGDAATTRPLDKVTLMIQGAGTAVSGKDGRCTLRFKTLRAGDNIIITSINKPGYQLFNADDTRNWLISRNNQYAYTVYLISDANAKRQREQMQKSAQQHISKEYDKLNTELKKIKNELTDADYEYRKAQLEKEYLKQLENIDAYIYKLTHINMSNLDETEAEAMKKLAEGDVAGALAQLETMDIEGIIERQANELTQLQNNAAHMEQWLEDIHSQQERLKVSIDNKVALLELQKTEAADQQAISLLETAIKADGYHDMDWMTRLSSLCYNTRQYSRLKKTLVNYIANPHLTTLDSVRVLSNIANCLRREDLDDEYLLTVNLADSLLTKLEPQMSHTSIWNLCSALICIHRTYTLTPEQLELASDSLFGFAFDCLSKISEDDVDSYTLEATLGSQILLLSRCPDQFLNSPRGRAEYDRTGAKLEAHYANNPARWQNQYINHLTQQARLCYLQGEYEYGYEQYMKIFDVINERFESNPSDNKIRRCNIISRLVIDLYERSRNYPLCAEWCKKLGESIDQAKDVLSVSDYDDFVRRHYTMSELVNQKLTK